MNLTRESIENLYFEERLSVRQIASRLGCSPSTIMKALEDLPLRSKSEAAVGRYEPLSLAGNFEELAYLVGVYLGDGSLVQSSRTELLDIACDAKYPGLIDRFASLVNRVFGKAPVLRGDPTSNCVHIRLYGKGISKTLGMDLGPKMDAICRFQRGLKKTRNLLAGVYVVYLRRMVIYIPGEDATRVL